MICCHRLLRLSVEINSWGYLLSLSVEISCWDSLLSCWDYLLRSAFDIICCDRLSKLYDCSWEYLLTSADQPNNRTIIQQASNQAKKQCVLHWDRTQRMENIHHEKPSSSDFQHALLNKSYHPKTISNMSSICSDSFVADGVGVEYCRVGWH